MERVLNLIMELKKDPRVARAVNVKLEEFRKNGKKSRDEIFKELCFCILTANFNAKKAIAIHERIGDGFLTLSESQLAGKLREFGYRYPNTRAHYIVEARRDIHDLMKALKSYEKDKLREWLVKNIKGLGYKEASHFLRNIGYRNYAIIDFHIIDVLVKYGLIERPDKLSKKEYFELENILRRIAEKVDMNLAELDLYLWFSETGKILK